MSKMLHADANHHLPPKTVAMAKLNGKLCMRTTYLAHRHNTRFSPERPRAALTISSVLWLTIFVPFERSASNSQLYLLGEQRGNTPRGPFAVSLCRETNAAHTTGREGDEKIHPRGNFHHGVETLVT